jgi:hypothetical protein
MAKLGNIRVKKLWAVYFGIKLFYMFFAVFVFSKLTTLGDTFDYLHTPLAFSFKIFYSSTALMQFTGALFRLIFQSDLLACLPLNILSFYGIYYAVDRLNLYRYATYIIILFSLPNFAVWTSIHGKEAVGCFFSAVLAVAIIKMLNGPYRLKFIDYAALYLCLMFKPQYLLFIMQAGAFIFIARRFSDKRYVPMVLGLLIIAANVTVIYLFRDMIDTVARGMAVHFKSNNANLAQSTRSEAPWLETYGFFHSAPYGMFIAFFGPTLPEMLRKPAQMLAGCESILMIGCFLFLLWPRLKYNLFFFRFNPTVLITYLILFVGILFIHYPFGFLNPGSAIRYRANFYALFILLLLYLFTKPAGIKSQFATWQPQLTV